MELTRRALAGVRWSAADLFLKQGLRFAITIALARMLSPEEFGTVALLYLFTGIAGVFVDSGFSSALIQKQDASHVDESTVFWLNVTLGATMAVLLALLAPTISAFFGISVLEPLVMVLALNLFIAAIGTIHGTLLTKRLDFRTQMVVGGAATFVSGGIAIWMAWNGYGVWSLAAQTLIAGVLTTALLWIINPWRPLLIFSVASARRLFGFGGYLFASGLLDVVYIRFYTLILGKFFGVHELAFYNRADGTKQLPVGILSSIFARVAFPLFSSIADDPARLRQGVRMSLRGIMLINIPVMAGLAALAAPITQLLFGEVWLPSAPILAVLCLGGIFWPLHVVNLNVLMAQGHSRLFFRLEVIKKTLGTLVMIAGATFGPLGVAWAFSLFGVVGFFINAHYTGKLLDYGAWRQVGDFLPSLLLGLPMGLAVTWASAAWDVAPMVEVPALSAAGAVLFFGAAWLFRLGSLRDVLALAKRQMAV